ncbi:MAG: hypothetical protein ACTS7I_03175 [Candidatus Hodgkinia cicadicola]
MINVTCAEAADVKTLEFKLNAPEVHMYPNEPLRLISQPRQLVLRNLILESFFTIAPQAMSRFGLLPSWSNVTEVPCVARTARISF